MDDNEDVRYILSTRLQSAGFDVGDAADGAEGLEQLRRTTWDIVVLDLVMPGMDGFEFLSELKKMPSAKPPVLVMTQRDDAETRQRALALGAAHYVPKGHAFSREFVSTVRKWAVPPPGAPPPVPEAGERRPEEATKAEPLEARPEAVGTKLERGEPETKRPAPVKKPGTKPES